MTLLLIILLIFALTGCGCLGVALFQQNKLAKSIQSALNAETASKISLDAELQRLRPYSVIPDAEVQADAIIKAAQDKASEISSQYQKYADDVTQWANQSFESVTAQTKEITDSAHVQETDSLQNKDFYEQTAQAMKNVIEGYGDRYIIPSQSLLDDLADEFNHTAAGVELKKARAHTREMVKQRTAAVCDYVEAARRDTAINFVVDAFNGKVDSMLADIKGDNAGTLEQEIRDAFSLVNFNGHAFRNARITDDFLAARLTELKWAAVAQQLRLQERQEQQQIREKMRDEEKARREYEKTIKDAAKEQDLLQKAMEAAKQQVENANETERAQYEHKLADLKQQLLVAEEKGQRAISMAQQTKKGHVYIISNIGSFGEGVYKIGQTRRIVPEDRVDELGDSSVPFDFDVHVMVETDDAPALERQMHKRFVLAQINKVNFRKEFFRINLETLKTEIDRLGFDVKWTMAAEAQQYRESVAIEKRIQEDAAFGATWIQKQVRADTGLEPLFNKATNLEDKATETTVASST
jgi:hypothetical protein